MMTHDATTQIAVTKTRHLMSVREAASLLGCSRANLYSLIQRGIIPVICVGRAKGYRIDPNDIATFIAQRKHTKQSRPRKLIPPRPQLKHIKF